MPKVYDQQISWQPANGTKMHLDKLQDFITPALENAARAADNVQQSIVEMQDKQVAEAANLVAQKQAEIIKNFDEFSLKDPQGEMVNRSMKEWDKFIADMPIEARRRFERNNPKAREIFELKSKEAATDRARQYTTAKKKADVNRTAQDIIARGVTPEGIQTLLQEEYDRAGKSMTPDDFIDYQQKLGYAVQQGAIQDAISYGNLGRAEALNDRKEFTVNLSPEQVAKNRLAINKLMGKDDDGSGDGSGSASLKGDSLYNAFVRQTNDNSGSAAEALNVYSVIASGKPKSVVNAMGIDDNTVIAGGKTLAQIYNMYPEQRQKLMDKAAKAATLNNSPAMVTARTQVGNIAGLMVDIEKADSVEKKIEATEKLDSIVSALRTNGGAELMKLVAEDGYNDVFKKAEDAKLARESLEKQTMISASDVYGYGRVDFGNNIYQETDVKMSLPRTPTSEAQAMIDDASWVGKMSKADTVIPQRVDDSVVSRRFIQGADNYLPLKTAENEGLVPKGITEQYLVEAELLRKGITPMCLTTGITYQEYADCLYKKGWSAPYEQTMEFDQRKRNVTTLAASGRILSRSGGKKEADYNEGTYAWALDVVDGLILNEVLKNSVYSEESGLTGVTMQMINDSARMYRQMLRANGNFDEYIDTTHFSDNGFDPWSPNSIPECAADIKKSALYDFVDKRIVSLGGKEGSPQAEKIAEYMRGAIKDRDIKMKANYNTKTEFKTVNPETRGTNMVANAKMNKVVKTILNANQEE